MLKCQRKLRSFARSNPVVFALVTVLVMLLVYILYGSDEVSPLKPLDHDEHLLPYNKKPERTLDSFLMVLIVTAPKHNMERNTIRKTWLSDLDKGERAYKEVRYYFVIGTKQLPEDQLSEVEMEQADHHDMLFLDDLEDSYNNLSLKLGLMCEWLINKHRFRFLLKVDDDTFVRLDKILFELKADPSKDVNNLYWGYFYGKARVKQSGPWKETNWKLCDYYLPYARGGGYVVSYHLVQFVGTNWRIFQLYLSEDVTLGAWLASLKLTRVHEPRFDTEYKSRGCSNEFIVTHKQSLRDMEVKFANLRASGNLCKHEFSTFHGYDYNWDVPPSQCCQRSNDIP